MGETPPQEIGINTVEPSKLTSARNAFRRPAHPLLLQRMAQHKYDSQQIIFVKNVPQDAAPGVAALYTQYEPVETKNLYPAARITTFMIALPSASVADEALRYTDGTKIENSVITVERYNARQSMVARRDARRKRNGFWNGFGNGGGEDEGDGYEDGETLPDMTVLPAITEKVSSAVDQPEMPARKIDKGAGVSWANVASGATPGHSVPSSAPSVQEQSQRSSSVDTEPFPPYSEGVLSEAQSATWPSPHGSSSNTRCAPALGDTLTNRPATPARLQPTARLQNPEAPPQIVVTPATASIGPRARSTVPLPAQVRLSPEFQLMLGNLSLTESAQAQGSGSPEPNHSARAPSDGQVTENRLALPINSTQQIRRLHCGDCAFCALSRRRLEEQKRG